MQNNISKNNIPLLHTLVVLIAFPIISTLISLLLLNRSVITDFGLDFFNTFWIIISIWYILQILIIYKILKFSEWTFSDIGISLLKRQSLILIGGYLVVTILLLFLIEISLRNAHIDDEKLNTISSLTPKTTTARIIFIFMGLVAGLSEEIVYRGFAIKSLMSNNINKWLAILIATIPFIFQHGLKSIDQFSWFMSWGLIFGILFVIFKKLKILIIIHWIVILSAMVAILQVVK